MGVVVPILYLLIMKIAYHKIENLISTVKKVDNTGGNLIRKLLDSVSYFRGYFSEILVRIMSLTAQFRVFSERVALVSLFRPKTRNVILSIKSQDLR
jgi:aryl carrier-like protein